MVVVVGHHRIGRNAKDPVFRPIQVDTSANNRRRRHLVIVKMKIPRRLAQKMAATTGEYAALRAEWPEFESDEQLDAYLAERGLRIPIWTADDVGATEGQVGLAGSPTQVHKINFVVLESTESKDVPATPEGIQALIAELVHEYIVG